MLRWLIGFNVIPKLKKLKVKVNELIIAICRKSPFINKTIQMLTRPSMSSWLRSARMTTGRVQHKLLKTNIIYRSLPFNTV
jgi:hypothetical protein